MCSFGFQSLLISYSILSVFMPPVFVLFLIMSLMSCYLACLYKSMCFPLTLKIYHLPFDMFCVRLQRFLVLPGL